MKRSSRRSLLCLHKSLYRFYEPPVVDQRPFVLDVIRGLPGLDLVSEPLEFLYFLFQVRLVLVLLGWICGRLNLVKDALKDLDALGHLFENLFNFGCGGDESFEESRGVWAKTALP